MAYRRRMRRSRFRRRRRSFRGGRRSTMLPRQMRGVRRYRRIGQRF